MKERVNIFSILLDAICCVMCADGKMSTREQRTIHAILKKVKCPWTAEDVGKFHKASSIHNNYLLSINLNNNLPTGSVLGFFEGN